MSPAQFNSQIQFTLIYTSPSVELYINKWDRKRYHLELESVDGEIEVALLTTATKNCSFRENKLKRKWGIGEIEGLK